METLDLLNGLDLHKVGHASIVVISSYLTTGCGLLNILTGGKKNLIFCHKLLLFFLHFFTILCE